ncbi:MAG TPA: hypothetical protein VL132_12545 [Planctomycetaceae bacterium]|nr:hypothetical protein [Planctomycetaceae bacterium]
MMRLTRLELGVAVFLLTGLLIAGVYSVYYERASLATTGPGQIFDQPGRYAAASGASSVEIRPQPDGGLQFQWTSLDHGQRAGAGMSIAANQAWFAAWDDRGTLWLYNPPHGVHRFEMTDSGGSSSTRVGEFGGWEGVPEAFLRRLPEAELATYRLATAAVMPATSP